uniref:Uncharacterized protein n=1 Tax=Cacopsylla melanoneura TaxID=428564 RepID=A0A8D8RNL4_9HEMI
MMVLRVAYHVYIEGGRERAGDVQNSHREREMGGETERKKKIVSETGIFLKPKISLVHRTPPPFYVKKFKKRSRFFSLFCLSYRRGFFLSGELKLYTTNAGGYESYVRIFHHPCWIIGKTTENWKTSLVYRI